MRRTGVRDTGRRRLIRVEIRTIARKTDTTRARDAPLSAAERAPKVDRMVTAMAVASVTTSSSTRSSQGSP